MPSKFIGYRIKLYPNEEQIKIFNQYFGLARFVYNLALELQENNYQKYLEGKSSNKILYFIDLNNEIRKLRKEDNKYSWLCNYDSTTISSVIQDLSTGYKRFFSKLGNKPHYKSKKRCDNSFPTRQDRLVIEKDHIKLSSIGTVYTENIPDKLLGAGDKAFKLHRYLKYSNSRISYDGINYYISFTIKTDIDDQVITYNSNYNYKYNPIYQSKSYTKAIGIDLGCSGNNWIVMSDGYRKELPDFSKEEKKIARFQRKAARQRRINLERTNPDQEYHKSNNELKTNKKINKYYKRITNKRINAIYDACKHILDIKPEAVVMEDINANDMLWDYKNKKIPRKCIESHNHNIMNHAIYTVQEKFSYVLNSNDIPVILAPDDYPSTQMCSCCGNRQDIGPRKIYKCPICGAVMNRDDNASINLANWYYNSLT